MEMELEEGTVALSERIKAQFTVQPTDGEEMILIALCSIAISLKKIAEEANQATANMSMGQIK